MLQEAGELTTADQWGQRFSRSGDAAIVERKLAIDGEVLDAHIRKVHQDPIFLLDLDNLRSGITLEFWTECSPQKTNKSSASSLGYQEMLQRQVLHRGYIADIL